MQLPVVVASLRDLLYCWRRTNSGEIMRQPVGTVGLVFVLFFGSNTQAFAQDVEVMTPRGALYTASTSTLLWLGAAQGIIENCDGDLALIGDKLLLLLNAATDAGGTEYADMLAGVFSEGQRLGLGMGCRMNQLRLYEGYADLTFQSTIKALRMAAP